MASSAAVADIEAPSEMIFSLEHFQLPPASRGCCRCGRPGGGRGPLALFLVRLEGSGDRGVEKDDGGSREGGLGPRAGAPEREGRRVGNAASGGRERRGEGDRAA